jgi:DNA-directed RNA polymerase specialized sigma24 family protein/WD40 repeat protein
MSSDSSKKVFQRIQPLLQDERVSDTDLLEVLVEDGYAGLYLLARVITQDAKLARKVVVTVLSTLLAQRRSYWGEISLTVWINRLVLDQCHKFQRYIIPNMRIGLTKSLISDRYPTEENVTIGFLESLTKLSEQERASLVLRYSQGLSLEEIAAVLGSTVTRGHIFLKTARQACLDILESENPVQFSLEDEVVTHTVFLEQIVEAAEGILDQDKRSNLERHLGECKACRNKAAQLADGEAWLREQLSDLVGISLSDYYRHKLVMESQRLLARRKRWSQISLFSRQYLYTGLLLGLLVGLAYRFNLPANQPHEPAVRPAMTTISPTPDPFEGYLKFNYYVSPDDNLDDLAERTGLTVEEIYELNHMNSNSQLYEGRVLSLAVEESHFFPTTHLPEPDLPAPLTAQTDEKRILERMAESKDMVGSLWGDGRLIQYGPAGYSGPPFWEAKFQIWWHNEGHQVMIFGMFNPDEDFIHAQYSIPSGLTFYIDSSSDNYYAYPNQGQADWFFTNPTLLFGLDEEEAALRVVGSDQILGRQALVVDMFQSEGQHYTRLWIDAERGLVLRLRLFKDAEMQTTLMDMGFENLALDIDLPEVVFSPTYFKPKRFAADHTGTPLAEGVKWRDYPWPLPADRRTHERLLPPEEFDPAGEPLTLQWPVQPGPESKIQVEVFAGEYYMGILEIGRDELSRTTEDFHIEPPFNTCTRSPDGRQVIISVSSLSSFEPRLYWFQVDNPENHRELITTHDAVREFAFDPSSRFLVYHACDNGACGIHILDTLTKTSRVLFDSGRIAPSSLTWSPDGNLLAFLGSKKFGNARKIFVVRVTSGHVVYEADYGWDARSVPPDSPTHSWGVQFPKDESFFPFVDGCRYPFEYQKWVGTRRMD